MRKRRHGRLHQLPKVPQLSGVGRRLDPPGTGLLRISGPSHHCSVGKRKSGHVSPGLTPPMIPLYSRDKIPCPEGSILRLHLPAGFLALNVLSHFSFWKPLSFFHRDHFLYKRNPRVKQGTEFTPGHRNEEESHSHIGSGWCKAFPA